jgi:cell division protein FtsB
VYKDINEYLERPGEVLSMFSEALRILDRNTAELMVDRMKDEMETLKAQNEELKLSSEEKDAEIARLKKLLEEQNK